MTTTTRIEITELQERLYLDQLAEGWTHTAAARNTGIPLEVWRRHRRASPRFEAACVEALDAGTDVLEDEAVRRASKGVRKGVYYKGDRVATELEYSDSLLQFLLKARRPEKYRERQEVVHVGLDELAARIAAGRQRVAGTAGRDDGDSAG